MRKTITIVLAFIYLFTTSGIVISTHYCMGEVAGYAFGQNDEHLCGVCGMSNEGCCHDDLSVLKVEDDHQIVHSGIVLPWVDIHTPVTESTFSFKIPSHKNVNLTQSHAPPVSYDRQAMFCVYRI